MQYSDLDYIYMSMGPPVFSDSNHGIILSWHHSWFTSNGGKVWKKYNSTFNNFPTTYPNASAVFPLNDYPMYTKCPKLIIYSGNKTEVNETELHQSPKVFPNPLISGAILNIFLDLNGSKNIKISIYNSLGVLVDSYFENNLQPGLQIIKYRTENKFSHGVYFLKLGLEGKQIKTVPFVIM